MSIFRRIPSVRERARRGSLGQVSGGAAIHDAIAKGKIHLAKFILDAVEGQSVVNSRDVHGKTPLIRAIKLEDSETRMKALNLLIRYGANVNHKDNMGRTALSYAAELQSNDAIRALVKNNVDPNIEDNNGNTPLLYCSMVDNAVGIGMLTKSYRRLGLDVDRLNSEGMSALMVAGKNGFMECVKLLAHEGKASLLQRDKVRNMTAVEWAREGGCSTPEIEAFLPKIHRQSKAADTSPSKLCTDLQRNLQKHESLDSNCSSTDGCSPRGTSRDSSIEELCHRQDSSSVSVAFPTPPTYRKNVKASSVDILSRRFHALHPIKNLNDLPSMKHHFMDMKRSSLPEVSDPNSFQYHCEKSPIILSHDSAKIDPTSRHAVAFAKRTKPSTTHRRPLSAVNRQTNHRQSKSFDGVTYESNSAEELRPMAQVGKSLSMNHLANPITKNLLDLTFLSHSTETLSPIQSRSDCGSTEQSVDSATGVSVDVNSHRSPPRSPDHNMLKVSIRGQSEMKTRLPPLSPRHSRKEPWLACCLHLERVLLVGRKGLTIVISVIADW